MYLTCYWYATLDEIVISYKGKDKDDTMNALSNKIRNNLVKKFSAKQK